MDTRTFIIYSKNFFLRPRIVLGSLFHRLRVRILSKLTGRPTILIERAGGGAIGDNICSFPAILALRLKYPNAIITYSARTDSVPVVKMGHVADYVVESDWSDLVPKVFPHDYTFRFCPLLADQDTKLRKQLHTVDDICESLGVTPKSRQPLIHVPILLKIFAKNKLTEARKNERVVIGIHVGPTWPVKEWPHDSWQKLVDLIESRFHCSIIQLGSDLDTHRRVIKAPRISNTYDWVGHFNISQTISIIEGLDFLVGIDSALLHIAGAVGTPCAGLFGPVDPILRLPPETPSIGITSNVPCLGCHHRTPILHWIENCPFSIRCMTELSPEYAFLKISDKLTKIINEKQRSRLITLAI